MEVDVAPSEGAMVRGLAMVRSVYDLEMWLMYHGIWGVQYFLSVPES